MNSTLLRSRRALVVLAVVLLAVLAVLALLLSPSGGGDTPGTQAAPPSTMSKQAVVDQPSPVDAGRAAAEGLVKSEPVSVDIPKIGAHSSLVPLGLNADNSVQVPPVSQPLQAGWYVNGPTPGEVGPAVILGHVDGNKQRGIFFRLKELAPGDRIAVARKDGKTADFVVTKVDKVPKDTFPTDAVYGDTADAQLRLITCGGVFDRASHNYLDNIIVYAQLTGR
ncbi:class F sortase [Amycolatopsis sp. H20-H5]|uniref:class F sortase n=1 Tax=Amycolatopsis sp. H20-H5 TaxID=3046309 RepID=UPI002DB93E36|nr:class F sortase [Amycolatopsis sp. H20-H5]MEC3981578.1 class F sortase [Amycolatopsis sp. H20-H5]